MTIDDEYSRVNDIILIYITIGNEIYSSYNSLRD